MFMVLELCFGLWSCFGGGEQFGGARIVYRLTVVRASGGVYGVDMSKGKSIDRFVQES